MSTSSTTTTVSTSTTTTHSSSSTTSSITTSTSSASTTSSTSTTTTPLPGSSTPSPSSTITTASTTSSQPTSLTSGTTSTSSSDFSSTSTPPPQSTTSSLSSTSTFFQTTVITTDAQGSVVTVLTTASASNTPAVTNKTSSSTSHTGAIVGGTVGGVAGLALLALLLLFCLRRQRRKDDFDGNFDPDRVGHSQGPLDLAAAEVEPYTYPQEHAQHGQVDMREASVGAGSMHQYYNASPGAQPHPEDSRSHTDTHTTTSYLSPNAAPVAGAAGFAYAPSSSSQSPPRSAKEREAFSRYNTTVSSTSGNALPSGSTDTSLHVMNPPDDPVVVHQDGGRVPIPVDEEQVPREIPPTYDSIPSDSRR